MLSPQCCSVRAGVVGACMCWALQSTRTGFDCVLLRAPLLSNKQLFKQCAWHTSAARLVWTVWQRSCCMQPHQYCETLLLLLQVSLLLLGLQPGCCCWA
jgi:hypothetical protein